MSTTPEKKRKVVLSGLMIPVTIEVEVVGNGKADLEKKLARRIDSLERSVEGWGWVSFGPVDVANMKATERKS